MQTACMTAGHNDVPDTISALRVTPTPMWAILCLQYPYPGGDTYVDACTYEQKSFVSFLQKRKRFFLNRRSKNSFSLNSLSWRQSL